MLRHALLATTLSLTTLFSQAQEVAITETGKRIIIYPDGKWSPETNSTKSTHQNSKIPQLSTDSISLNKGAASVHYDPKIWTLNPQKNPIRFELQHKDGDGYAIIISERIEATSEALKDIALTNARSVATDIKILSQESININGTDIIALKYQGTSQNISFIFYGYFYGGKAGCIQVLTYTTTNLFDEYQKDFINFLNGFIVTKK